MPEADITTLFIAIGAVMASIATIVKNLWDKKEMDRKIEHLDSVKVSKLVCEGCKQLHQANYDHVVEKVDDLKTVVTDGFTCINKKLDKK